jgi:tRNA wybutosine-synthesizing protein 3
MLHVHGNVKDSQESLWTAHVLKSIDEIARFEGMVFWTLGLLLKFI